MTGEDGGARGMNEPAGWYPADQGRVRYWDGSQWTEHVATAPGVSLARRPRGGAPQGGQGVGVARAAWLGWGGLAGVALLGGATSGVSGVFALTGVFVMVIALIALVRGHVSWACLHSRASGAATLGAAVVLTAVPGVAGLGIQKPPIVTAPEAPQASAAAPTISAPRPGAVIATPTASPSPSPSPTLIRPAATAPASAKGTALPALAELSVKGRAPKTGCDRAQFGQAGFDADRNGCDTRDDILRLDLKEFTLKGGTNGCLVLSGTLEDPYTGDTINFSRGQGTSSAVQVDHVVALCDAWQKGAQQLTRPARTAFANDPLGLMAVDGPTNSAKGDGDAATWLPPLRAHRCAYVARQVAVKAKYQLWVTAAERDAIERVLRTCPTQKLPTSSAIALGGGTVLNATPETTRSTPDKGTGNLDPRFGTCREAIDAGYGPYDAGKDPEYDWYQDRDSDGAVCET